MDIAYGFVMTMFVNILSPSFGFKLSSIVILSKLGYVDVEVRFLELPHVYMEFLWFLLTP